MLDDLRQAIRSLAREPVLAATVVLIIGLGVGLNTAVFSVFHSAVLKSVPYPDAQRLFMIRGRDLKRGWDDLDVAALAFSRLQTAGTAFEEIGAWRPLAVNIADAGRHPERIKAVASSPNLLPLLGVSPLRGRDFSGDAEAHQRPAAVLSYGLWQRLFGADPGVLGHSVKVDGRRYLIVGILPGDFSFPEPVEIWLPLQSDELGERDSLRLLGRLRQNASYQHAKIQIQEIAKRLVKDNPQQFGEWTMHLVRLNERSVDNLRPTLIILNLTVCLVLLIACFNVSGLLLVRARKRRKGAAVRIALGAGRIHIWRPFLAEGAVLGLASAVIGVLLALWGTRLLESYLADQMPHVNRIEIAAPVLGFALGISLITALLASLAPALQSFKVDIVGTLKAEPGDAGAYGRRFRMRDLLTVCQVALALVLLSGAALMINTILRLQGVDAGFQPHGLLVLELDLPHYKYPEAHQQVAFYQDLLERIGTLPGVESASAASHAPLLGNMTLYFSIEGRSSDEPEVAYGRAVWSNYLETMDIAIPLGRGIGPGDLLEGRPGAAVINQYMAAKYWPQENPLGQVLRVGDQSFKVVGVAQNVRHRDLRSRSGPVFYIPFTRYPRAKAFVVVRTSSLNDQVIARLREQVWAVDEEQPIVRLETMTRHLEESYSETQIYALLMGVFAALAVSLALVGFYATVAARQRQRNREFGIRMALGAARMQVLKLVLMRAAALALCGILLGLAAAFGLTRFLSSWLFETSPTDFGILAAISATLVVLAVAASLLPALRATTIDPAAVLRHP